MYTVHPTISKINYIGLSYKNTTNTIQKYNRYSSTFDKSNNKVFFFTNQISLDPSIFKQFTRNNSVTLKILNKTFNFLT